MDEIIIDGNKSRGELLELAYSLGMEKEGWRVALGEFLLDWLNEDDSIEVKTSGSTGKPKIIRLEKHRMSASARLTLQAFDLHPNSKVLLPLSAGYIAGKMMIVRALVGKLILHVVQPSNDFWKKSTWPGRVDFAPLVPMQVYAALEMDDAPQVFSRIKKILVGGAPLEPASEMRLGELHSEAYHSYGMTETMSHVALRKITRTAETPIYRALPGIDFKADDRDCLVVLAPDLVDNPLHTNDRVVWKSKKEFTLLGRADHMINTGGVKVQPEEVERQLSPIMNRRFLIAGLPDPTLGERVALILEGDEPEPDELEKIKRYSIENLERYAQPRVLLNVLHFEETLSGKIDRPATLSRGKEIK